MRIGLLGLFGTGNSGNDGSLQAMIGYLRENVPDAELVCFCPNPAKVEKMFDVRGISTGHDRSPGGLFARLNTLFGDVPRRCLTIARPFKQTAGFDVLIVPGTGLLDDFRDSPFGWPFLVFRWCLGARMSGARILFVSVGAGPIRSSFSRWLLKKAAQMAHYRSYRDKASKDFMTSIGFDTRSDRIFPDLAFKLPVPSAAPRSASVGRTVGVGVMAYSGWRGKGEEAKVIYERYIMKLAWFVRQLLERDFHVRLLTGDAEDKDAIGKLLHELGKTGHNSPVSGRLVAATAGATLQELMDEIAQTDIVVCTRFHNVVCAVKLARPTISLGYAPKNEALLADVGLEGFHQHAETFQTDVLMHDFERVFAERESLATTIRARTEFYDSRLAEQDALLNEEIFRSCPDRRPSSKAGRAARLDMRRGRAAL